MKPTDTELELRDALMAFETSLETPVVSGELASWIEEVQKTWTETSDQVRRHVQQLHPREYDEIAREDPELLAKIEALRVEDGEIEAVRERLDHAISRTAQHLPKLEPDEEKGMRHVERLIEEGLNFVNRVRKQEVAIRTWFVEAFNRDRGPVD